MIIRSTEKWSNNKSKAPIMDGNCECGRTTGQCVKGDSERCPAEDDADVMICPVTMQPCMTEHDEFCDDYGCAKKAGMPVED